MRCGSAFGLCALGLTLAGCDPTSGLADSAEAALPDVKRYFDGRGSRAADGPWSRVVVDLDPDTLYHVGARRLDDAEPTFHLFGTDVQEGCAVSPNAGTWLMGKPHDAPFRVLPYLEDQDERGRGRLRFTTLECEVQEVEVENAGRPYPRLYDNGYLVPTNDGYTFVDPWSGEQRTIAENLRSALVWKGGSLLWDGGELKSYGEQFEADKGEVFGSGITAVVQLHDFFLVEDDAGLHRVTFDPTDLTLLSTPVLPDACGLQGSGAAQDSGASAWVALQLPCGNPRPSLVELDEACEPVSEPIELPVEVDSRYARALVSMPMKDGTRPVAAVYLTDVADERGTLWAWQTGSDSPLRIAEKAGLNPIYLESSESGWDARVQANYQQLGNFTAYDWVRFSWSGQTSVMAERIVSRSNGELLVNFDGVAGDIPNFVDGGVQILAEDVPPFASETTSYLGDTRFARVDHFDGSSGRVCISTNPDDPDSWQSLGNGVTPESVRFTWFMPALLFLENWDSERGTGSLVAYNYELDARATIADGVSSFDLTSYPWDGVLYAVPHGRDRGLWFSKAK